MSDAAKTQDTPLPSGGSEPTPAVAKQPTPINKMPKTKKEKADLSAATYNLLIGIAKKQEQILDALKDIRTNPLNDINMKMLDIVSGVDALYKVMKEISSILGKKIGIFQVAASQVKQRQPQLERSRQRVDDLPADLKDLSEEDREKLVSCPGGVKLDRFYPDRQVWIHMNFDILEPRGYKWIKNEQDKQLSHWEKEVPST